MQEFTEVTIKLEFRLRKHPDNDVEGTDWVPDAQELIEEVSSRLDRGWDEGYTVVAIREAQ